MLRRVFRPFVFRLEDRTLLSTVTWINPNGGDWDAAGNWSSDAVPTVSDNVLIPITGITITHSVGDDSVNSLDSEAAIVMSGGSLTFLNQSVIDSSLEVSESSTLSGSLTVDGQAVLDDGASLSGDLALTVAGPFSLNSGTSISISAIDAQGGGSIVADNNSYIDGTALTLQGGTSFTALGGAILLQNGASITNQGTITADLNTGFNISDTDGTSSFTNNGSITVSGSGYLGIGAANTVNDGSVEVQGGSFTISGAGTSTGSFNGAAGTVIDIETNLGPTSSLISAGSVGLAGPVTIAGLYNVSGTTATEDGYLFQLTGQIESLGDVSLYNGSTLDLSPSLVPNPLTIGSLNLAYGATLSGSFALNVSGLFTLAGGTTLAVPAINAQGGSIFTADNSAFINGTVLVLSGNTSFTSNGGSYFLNSGASITNQGTITADLNTGFNISDTDGTSSFTNNGSITVSGSGYLGIGAANTVNDGSVEVQGGSFTISRRGHQHWFLQRRRWYRNRHRNQPRAHLVAYLRRQRRTGRARYHRRTLQRLGHDCHRGRLPLPAHRPNREPRRRLALQRLDPRPQSILGTEPTYHRFPQPRLRRHALRQFRVERFRSLHLGRRYHPCCPSH